MASGSGSERLASSWHTSLIGAKLTAKLYSGFGDISRPILKAGGPILPVGIKAKGLVGIPPPRTVIGAPSQAYEQRGNCGGAFSVLRSLCRTQNDAVRYNALPHESPHGGIALDFDSCD
jgi:hypothetical protein